MLQGIAIQSEGIARLHTFIERSRTLLDISLLGRDLERMMLRLRIQAGPALDAAFIQEKGQVHKCRRCGYEADRHFVACVNMFRMWGIGLSPMSLPKGKGKVPMVMFRYISQGPAYLYDTAARSKIHLP